MSATEARARNAFSDVVKNFFGNRKDNNYQEIVEGQLLDEE